MRYTALDKLAAEDVIAPLLVVLAALGFSAAGRELLSYEGPFGVGYSVAILSRDSTIELPTEKRDGASE